MTDKPKEKGAALIAALGLMTTIAVIAVGITEAVNRSTQRAIAVQGRDQAIWWLLGAEDAAVFLLETQAKAQDKIDTEDERWLASPFVFPFENAILSSSFRDRSDCYNVNGLVTSDSGDQYSVNPEAISKFSELFLKLGGDIRTGENLANAAADFIDSNDSFEPGGAENFSYSRKTIPYSTSGQLFVSLHELRAVEGWTADIFRQMAPYLCARPDKANPSLINLNTLRSDSAPLLATVLGDVLSINDYERLIESRPPNGYADAEGFLSRSEFDNVEPPFGPEISGQLATFATYIEFTTRVSYDTGEFEMTSVMTTGDGQSYLVERRYLGGPNR